MMTIKKYTVEQQMARFGIPETETGPYVSTLKTYIQKKLDSGMLYMSAGSWDEEAKAKLSWEEIARGYLSWNWGIDQGYSYPIHTITKPIYWQHDFSNDIHKKKLVIKWKSLFGYYVINKFYEYKAVIRRIIDINIFGIRNPYA